MNQRTCNIVMCCKGNCNIGGRDNMDCLQSIAAYMSKECGCKESDYHGVLMEDILREALFDWFTTCDSPSGDLRQLLRSYVTREVSLVDRICTLFQLTDVWNKDRYTNGFTEDMIKQSEIMLETKKEEG